MGLSLSRSSIIINNVHVNDDGVTYGDIHYKWKNPNIFKNGRVVSLRNNILTVNGQDWRDVVDLTSASDERDACAPRTVVCWLVVLVVIVVAGVH